MKAGPLSPAVFLACLAALALYLYGTVGDGLAVSPDSAYHIAAAESLIRDGTFTNYDGTPYVWWPPLFAMLLAGLGGALGIDVEVAALLLNGAALVGIVVCASILFRENLASRLWANLATALLALSYPLHWVAGKVWSESAYILLALLAVLAMTRYARAPDTRWLLAIAALTSLAMLQRTVGAGVAATGFFTILLLAPAPSWRSRLARSSIYGVIAATASAIWAIRKMLVAAPGAGERGPPVSTWLENVGLALQTMVGWFVPGRLLGTVTVALAVAGVIGVLVVGLASTRKEAWQADRLRALLPAAVFGVAHVALSILASSLVALDTLDTRYLGPAFPFVVLFGFVGVEWAEGRMQRLARRPQLVRAALAVAVLLLFAKPVQQTVLNAMGRLEDFHHNFRSARWANSEVIALIEGMPAQNLWFSNRPDAIYVQTGLRADHSPLKKLYSSEEAPSGNPTEVLDREIAANGKAYLAWFENAGNLYLSSLEELKGMYHVETVADLSDGSILTVEARRE